MTHILAVLQKFAALAASMKLFYEWQDKNMIAALFMGFFMMFLWLVIEEKR